MNPNLTKFRSNRGITLLEVLISAAILSTVVVCISSLMWTSKAGIDHADENRDSRYIADLVMGYAENSDFVMLFKTFGSPFPECPNCLKGGDNDLSLGLLRGGQNVLGVDDFVMNHLKEKGWNVDLKFRFLTRAELGYKKADDIKPESGVLRFQAGVVWLQLLEGGKVIQEVKKSVFCPMIVGRPGLNLRQCPAVNPAVRDQGPLAAYP